MDVYGWWTGTWTDGLNGQTTSAGPGVQPSISIPSANMIPGTYTPIADGSMYTINLTVAVPSPLPNSSPVPNFGITPQVVSSTCGNFVSASPMPGTMTGSSMTFTIESLPSSHMNCSSQISSGIVQLGIVRIGPTPVPEPPITVSFNLPAAPVTLGLKTWPIAEAMAATGYTLGQEGTPPWNAVAWLNSLLGGAQAQAGTVGCKVLVYSDALKTLDKSDTSRLSNGYQTDANGCLWSGGAIAQDGVSIMWEPSGQSKTYFLNKGCAITTGTMNPASAYGPSATQPLIPGASGVPPCQLTYTDGSGNQPAPGSGIVTAQVIAPCPGTGTLAVGDSCFAYASVPNDSPSCIPDNPFPSFNNGWTGGGVRFTVTPMGVGTYDPATEIFTRTGTGPARINEYAMYVIYSPQTSGGKSWCGPPQLKFLIYTYWILN